MQQPINVMLVEDNPQYSEVIELALGEESDIDLVARFGTAEMALRSLSGKTGSSVSPDVILLDLRLPGRDGLEALPDFLATAPEAKVIILTQSDAESDVIRAISLGAAGYLLKLATVDEITEGIRAVMQGGAPIEAHVARFLLASLKSYLPPGDRENQLTLRELEVLRLLGEGLVKKEIAERLSISYGTVDTHVSHIYHKLSVSNAPAAISKAYQLGILQPGRE